MTFSVIASAAAAGTTSGIDTTGADLLVAVVGAESPTISDSKGNTWTGLTLQSSTGSSKIFYCLTPTVGSGHTFDPGVSYRAVAVLAASGADAYEAENGAIGTTPLSTGSLTPSVDDCLVVAAGGYGHDANTFGIGGGFTIAASRDGVTGVSYGALIAYLIQTTAAAANPSISWSGSPGENQNAHLAVFTPVVGGGTTLTIQDATHGHTADGVSLTQQHQLAVQDASHAHSADNLALTQQHELAVADATHGHTAENLTLSTEIELSIADALHSHSVDNITLVQQHVLVVADATHGHSADNAVLETGTNLAVADASHGHTVDNLVLTQQHVLVVADALHGHTADNVVLIDPAALEQQPTLGGRGSRGLLDLDTDAHIRAVEELHEARLKQRQADEQPAPVSIEEGKSDQVEQMKPGRSRKRKGPVLPADVIAAGIDPAAKTLSAADAAADHLSMVSKAGLPAKVQQVEAADSVNDDEFAIVLAQFLLAA